MNKENGEYSKDSNVLIDEEGMKVSRLRKIFDQKTNASFFETFINKIKKSQFHYTKLFKIFM